VKKLLLFNSLALLASFCFVSSVFPYEKGNLPIRACEDETKVSITLEEKKRTHARCFALKL